MEKKEKWLKMLNGMIEEMKKEGHQIPDDLEVKHSTKQRLI